MIVQVKTYSIVYVLSCTTYKWRWYHANAWIWFWINRGIEEIWLIFKEENCNARLSMVTDDVNPFGELGTNYSIWPVFVINNNLPPWMSINREHVMLELIIPGIFLRPLTTYNQFIFILHFCTYKDLIIYIFKKIGKHQVRDMDVYLEPL